MGAGSLGRGCFCARTAASQCRAQRLERNADGGNHSGPTAATLARIEPGRPGHSDSALGARLVDESQRVVADSQRRCCVRWVCGAGRVAGVPARAVCARALCSDAGHGDAERSRGCRDRSDRGQR
eukprot:Amastigsp_a841231_77.p4 type:complete len:125 gc:universal Amastigsp_a841231_77:1522-1148(-)